MLVHYESVWVLYIYICIHVVKRERERDRDKRGRKNVCSSSVARGCLSSPCWLLLVVDNGSP